MDPKAARIQAIGEALYGEAGWKSRLADALGLSRQHIGAIASGERIVTRNIEEKLADVLASEIIPHLEVTASDLRKHVAAIAAERKTPHMMPDAFAAMHCMDMRTAKAPYTDYLQDLASAARKRFLTREQFEGLEGKSASYWEYLSAVLDGFVETRIPSDVAA